MMNIKKYRAATTREALEQIKKELGEDAFVLETKQVKSGGFFGLRSEMQIEMSAAAPNVSPQTTAAAPAKHAAPSSSYNSILDLKEDTPAAPKVSNQTLDREKNSNQIIETNNENSRNILINALNARTAEREAKAAQELEAIQPPAPMFFSEDTGTFRETIEVAEVSANAPRLVHQKKEEPKPAAPVQNVTSVNIAENASPSFSNHELERLRAEMREIKFSLGTYTNRHNAQTWQGGNNAAHEDIFNSPFYESYLDLTAIGISPELSQKLINDVSSHFREGSVPVNQVTKLAILQAVSTMIEFAHDPLKDTERAIIAFIGSTGVGKTTTIAKIAARVALHEQRRVELVTIDTYRIAAVEQLKTYAEIIGAGCHVVRSVFELDAVLHRLPGDASVLIDTTGRNPHDLADQHELSDYLRRHEAIRKCLTIQATTHPLDGMAAIKKFGMYGVDCLALTKMDETTRPGAMLELSANSGLPLTYLCMGQCVPEDLYLATPETFANQIIR